MSRYSMEKQALSLNLRGNSSFNHASLKTNRPNDWNTPVMDAKRCVFIRR